MSSNTSTYDLKQLFGLTRSHTLTLSRTDTQTCNDTEYKVQWLDEHDANEILVARYRSWSKQAKKPPYRQQTGWERFSIKGHLLAREVRYSKRETNDWLH